MKAIPITFLITFLVLTSTTFAKERSYCSKPQKHSCSFYVDCLEANTSCGSEGYALAYGYHYCNVFLDLDSELTEKGLKWRDSTMQCLQRKLVPFAIDERLHPVSCDRIEQFAFKTHAPCYTQKKNSICFLDPIKDLPAIMTSIAVKDLLTSESKDQVLKVAQICVKQVRAKLEGTQPLNLKPSYDGETDQNLRFWLELAKARDSR